MGNGLNEWMRVHNTLLDGIKKITDGEECMYKQSNNLRLNSIICVE